MPVLLKDLKEVFCLAELFAVQKNIELQKIYIVLLERVVQAF